MFLLDAEARWLTPKTITYYREQLTPFVKWLQEQGVADLDAVTPTHIRRYLVSLQQRELTPRSQHAAARSIRGGATGS